jgi:hypothetical protein
MTSTVASAVAASVVPPTGAIAARTVTANLIIISPLGTIFPD